MNKNKNFTNEDEIDLREVFKGFTNRKWWFIGTFIIILIAGLLITFIRDPGYDSNSEIEIIDIKDYYVLSIQEYFPGVFPELRTISPEDLSAGLESEEILKEVARDLSFDISENELAKAIFTSTSQQERILVLNVNHTSPETAYEINRKVLDVFQARINSELGSKYDSLVQRVEERLTGTQKEIIELTSEVQEYVINFDLELLKNIIGESSNINLDVIKYIPPDLSIELDYLSTTYRDLKKIQYILEENKEFFTNEIEIIKEPQIPDDQSNKNYYLGALISLFLAIISGIIVVFIVNYFLSFKKKL